MALDFLPESQFDPRDVGLMEQLISTERRIKGFPVLVTWMRSQPFEEPALGGAQLRDDFIKGEATSHNTTGIHGCGTRRSSLSDFATHSERCSLMNFPIVGDI